jgi:AraC-like DNA-binding protein
MVRISCVIVAFGIFLSVFFSSLLAAKPCRGGANRYLAGLVLSSGLSICYQVLYPTGFYRSLPHLAKVYVPTQFLIGPLLFLYVSAITEPGFRFAKRTLFHFFPFFLSLLYLAPFFAKSAEAKIAFVRATLSPARASSAEEWTVWLYVQASLWVYSILSLRKYGQYRRKVSDSVSNLSRYAWNWLLVFLVSVQVMLVSFLVVDIRMLEGIPLVAFNPFISVLMTGSIVFLGWRGLLRLDFVLPPSEDALEAPRPKKSGEEFESHFALIEEATRRDELFRSSELTISDLAESLGYSRNELSGIINCGGKVNFHDFINKLRVEYVQHALASAAGDQLNILQLAFDAGFNSKSVFNACFKKWTGVTPSLYRRQVSPG